MFQSWLLLLSLSFIFSCSQKQSSVADKVAIQTSKNTLPDVMLTVSIPQNSGLAFVRYKNFSIHGDSLFVINRWLQHPIDSAEIDNYNSDTLEIYTLDESKEDDLRKLLGSVDSLGYHTADGCVVQMGYPRFFISALLDGKDLNGFIANCYREHIFKLVDFLNECYPKGNVINYTKEALIETEKECIEYNYGMER